MLGMCRSTKERKDKMQAPKRHYQRPELIEYGTLTALTLGQHGSQPDFNIMGGVLANDNCSPAGSGPGGSGNSNPFVCLS